MNILVLSELFYPYGGGGELATYLYVKLLAGAGFRVAVLTNRFFGDREINEYDNLVIYRVPLFRSADTNKFSLLLRANILLSSRIRGLFKSSDVVYVTRDWYPAIVLAKFFKKPVLTHLHMYLPVCPISTNYNMITANSKCNIWHCLACILLHERSRRRSIFASIISLILNSTVGHIYGKLVSLSDALICVSEAQKKLIAEKAPSLTSKLFVLNNPLPPIYPTKIISEDFGYFGGESSLKGFDTVIQAINFLKKESKEFHVKIHAPDLNLNENQRKLIEPLGVIPYMRLENSDCLKLYSKLKTVIVPSLVPETFGYVALEALLMGRLVIASEIGGLPEVLEGCPGSWLFPVNDYRKLAKALLVVNSLTIEEASNLGAQNRAIIEEKFNDDKILKKFVYILNKIIS